MLFRSGLFYFKARKWYPGAVQRFREVLTDDPSFTGRDTVYYYLAQALILQKRPAEAVPYLDRMLKEFPNSPLAPLAKQSFETTQAAISPK